MTAPRSPRSMAGHRQIVVLGLAALLVVLAVTGSGILRATQARSELGRVKDSIHPALDELLELQGGTERVTDAYLRLVASTDADSASTLGLLAAQLGSDHRTSLAALHRFRRLSLGLPGEEPLLATIVSTLDVNDDAAAGALGVIGPVASTNGAALFDRITLLRTSMAGLAPVRDAIAELVRLYASEAEAAEGAAAERLDAVVSTTVAAGAVAGIPVLLLFTLVRGSTRRREHRTAELEAARSQQADRNDFETRLQRGFEMVHDEESSYPVIEHALVIASEGMAAELLVADSSRAHLRQVATSDAVNGGPGCAVGSPIECPAAQRGQTQLFPSSQAIDACPHLRGRPGGDCTAVCVPVSIAGKTAGVVHAVTGHGDTVPVEAVARLELVARKAGDRIGMLHAFARSETQARTDPLTGLLNRRSLESEVRELTASETDYAVAFGDLDHFKQLNDVHGHDAGDRALRLFARVLRDGVRPTDIPARYGGEEFVVVLPNCSVTDATVVLDRIRDRLADALLLASVPPFTVSFGVAGADRSSPFSEVVELADAALLAAKVAGRDRVLTSGHVVPAD